MSLKGTHQPGYNCKKLPVFLFELKVSAHLQASSINKIQECVWASKVVGLRWWCLEKSPLALSVALCNETLYVSLLLLVQRCVYCMCVFLFVCVVVVSEVWVGG